MELKLRRFGEGPVSLLWLHGFTGDGGALDHLRPALADAVSAVSPDLPGHGHSAAPAPGIEGYEETIRVLARLLQSLPVPRLLAGYSMGARLALAVALAVPDAISALLLESGSAGLREDEERARRRAEDEELCVLLEREGLAAFLNRWEEMPALASLKTLPEARVRALRERRLSQDARGLAAALRAFGQGVQPSLWEALPALRLPTFVVAGEADLKQARIAPALLAALPDARGHLLPHCGHAPHLEAPEVLARVLRTAARTASGERR